jgi:hypothetical protein
LGNTGKSLLKALKYAALYLGAAALAGVAQPEVISGALTAMISALGLPAAIAALVGQYAVPVIVSALAGLAQQVIKHRDKA